jgi:alpha-beta hydrolase superfamily lysophospholipase
MPDTVWSPDPVVAGAECRRLAARVGAGAVHATLVRRRAVAPTRRAVLYVHGWIDYFFQAHLADAWADAGWDFYAIDLHAYGRSLDAGERPNYCTAFEEYHPELEAALDVIAGEDGHVRVVLLGHSTGGLLAVHFAATPAGRARIAAVILNGPFLRLPSPAPLRALARAAAALGRVAPGLALPSGVSPNYAHSVHRAWRGEWAFHLPWKPVSGFPLHLGWLRAVLAAQDAVARGLALPQPILLVRSTRSWRSRRWDDRYLTSDGVLRVDDMRALAPRLGADVTEVAIEGAMHDAVLSASPVRARVIATMLEWAGARVAG